MYILRVEYKISDCIFLIKNIIISMQFQQINIVRKYCRVFHFLHHYCVRGTCRFLRDIQHKIHGKPFNLL